MVRLIIIIIKIDVVVAVQLPEKYWPVSPGNTQRSKLTKRTCFMLAHICKAVKSKSEQISFIVQKALSVEPYATPARVQSAVVLDALRRQKPLVEVM